METYMTEMDANRRYLVKVTRHDGTVCASGNFGNLHLAHEWIDRRRSEDAASVSEAGDNGRRLFVHSTLVSPVFLTRDKAP
jgi:hypothetical protein